MARYEVNGAAVAHVRDLIDSHQYVLDSEWGEVQPDAAAQNAYLERHAWADPARDSNPARRANPSVPHRVLGVPSGHRSIVARLTAYGTRRRRQEGSCADH